MKSLQHVQLIAKILMILTTVGLVFSLIGVGGALFGGIALLSVPLLGEALENLILSETGGTDPSTLAVGLIAVCIYLVGLAVALFFTRRYFKNELADGTPFTHRGADELLRTGIIGLAVPFGSFLIAEIVLSLSGAGNMITMEWDIIGGAVMLLLSFVFRYGADMREGKAE